MISLTQLLLSLANFGLIALLPQRFFKQGARLTFEFWPPQLVTDGPYRYIRHPIYSAYLLALLGACFCSPAAGTIACFLWGLIALNKTAAQEEKRLSESADLGNAYVRYMSETGRFFPPLPGIFGRPRQAK